MIGADEKKFCAAGDGTEFPDAQFIVIYGIMIEHIVFLKPAGIIYKVIIDTVFPNRYRWVINDALKIYGLLIPPNGDKFS